MKFVFPILDIMNAEAYNFLCEHKTESTRSNTDQFISIYGFEYDQCNHFRLKFNNIVKKRDVFSKTLRFGNLKYHVILPSSKAS